MVTGVCSIARFGYCTRDHHDKSIGGGVREWGIFFEVETRQDGEGWETLEVRMFPRSELLAIRS